MIPPVFSIRGPEGTLPYVAVVDGEPMLLWAQNRESAEGYIRAVHRNAQDLRVFRASNPRHHLGAQRIVSLTELG